MFQLDKDEWQNLKSQFVTSRWGGRRTLPYVFTEQGVAMLSGVLNSPTAIQVHIQIIRVFTKMRELLSTNNELLLEINKMRQEVGTNSKDIELIFQYLKQLEKAKQQEFEQQNRIAIGFKRKGQT